MSCCPLHHVDLSTLVAEESRLCREMCRPAELVRSWSIIIITRAHLGRRRGCLLTILQYCRTMRPASCCFGWQDSSAKHGLVLQLGIRVVQPQECRWIVNFSETPLQCSQHHITTMGLSSRILSIEGQSQRRVHYGAQNQRSSYENQHCTWAICWRWPMFQCDVIETAGCRGCNAREGIARAAYCSSQYQRLRQSSSVVNGFAALQTT